MKKDFALLMARAVRGINTGTTASTSVFHCALVRPPLSAARGAQQGSLTSAASGLARSSFSAKSSELIGATTPTGNGSFRLRGAGSSSNLSGASFGGGDGSRKYLLDADAAAQQQQQQQQQLVGKAATIASNGKEKDRDSQQQLLKSFSGVSSNTTGNEEAMGKMIITSSDPTGNTPHLVLEVLEEFHFVWLLHEGAADRTVTQQVHLDSRWSLLCGIQSCFVGQMMRFIEHLCELNMQNPFYDLSIGAGRVGPAALGGSAGQPPVAGKGTQVNTAAFSACNWENGLRDSRGCDSLALLWANDTLTSKDRSVPFAVRGVVLQPDTIGNETPSFISESVERVGKAKVAAATEAEAVPKKGDSNGAAASAPVSRLFRVMDLAAASPGLVSEWTIFTVFVEEAMQQVLRLVGQLHPPAPAAAHGSKQQTFSSFGLNLNAGELNLLFQLFHGCGK